MMGLGSRLLYEDVREDGAPKTPGRTHKPIGEMTKEEYDRTFGRS